MKGLLFHQQLEIRLDVEGEEFHQGDILTSELSIKNRGNSSQSIEDPCFAFALADLKKLKQKSNDAFEIIQHAELNSSIELAPGETTNIPWAFELDRNCPISEKTQSLCLLYGLTQGPHNNLQLPVRPHADIEGILLVLETSFQFVMTSQKSKAGQVIAKIKPPAGNRFSTVEHLELGFRLEGDALLLNYNFKVKKLEAAASTMTVKKQKLTFSQTLERHEYAPNGFIDSKLLDPKIEEILSQVGSKFS